MKKTEMYDLRWKEFRKYTCENNISRDERKLLSDWVRAGHSVYDIVESGYLPGPAYPPMDFIQACRLDMDLSEDMKGMTTAEKDVYLKAYIGYEDPPPEEAAVTEAKNNTPEIIEEFVRQLERDLFHLREFVWKEGIGAEAEKYVAEHKDDAVPFEW